MASLIISPCFRLSPCYMCAREGEDFCLRTCSRRRPSALFLHHVRVLILCLRIAFGLLEHSSNLALNCILHNCLFPRYQSLPLTVLSYSGISPFRGPIPTWIRLKIQAPSTACSRGNVSVKEMRLVYRY
jgi:hypothetical protein